jgi:hypothetical protein
MVEATHRARSKAVGLGALVGVLLFGGCDHTEVVTLTAHANGWTREQVIDRVTAINNGAGLVRARKWEVDGRVPAWDETYSCPNLGFNIRDGDCRVLNARPGAHNYFIAPSTADIFLDITNSPRGADVVYSFHLLGAPPPANTARDFLKLRAALTSSFGEDNVELCRNGRCTHSTRWP